MKHKRLLIFSFSLLTICAAAFVVWHSMRPLSQKELIITNDFATDSPKYFEEGTHIVDKKIVGKWQNTDNPQWFKVYYEDYDKETKTFWGKEWDENEDVYETDLNYHGNGWFRWVRKNNLLHEYATMDNRDIPLYRKYQLSKSSQDKLIYFDPDFNNTVYRFQKISNQTP